MCPYKSVIINSSTTSTYEYVHPFVFQHTLANNKRSALVSGHPKKLDRVEAQMQAIQSSLSSSSLAPPTYTSDSGQTINKKEVGMIVQLKRELEEKEKFTQR